MRLGIADHLGWAIAVTTTSNHEVVDRRRIELIEPGVHPAPIEHEAQSLTVAAATALVAEVRASVERASSAALDEIANSLPTPITSISPHARGWEVHLYDAKAVESQAIRLLAHRADEILQSPRATLGPPWAKDHRVALAATIVAS